MNRLPPLLVVLSVVAILGAWGQWRAHRERARWDAPATVPRGLAEDWMLRCLPGIGPVTDGPLAAAVRAGRFDELPDEAAAMARRLFE